MEWLGAAVLTVLVVCLGSLVVHSLKVGIAPMPSSRRAVAAVLQLVPPETEGLVLELGAGWGGLALALAAHAPAARVVAWESSWVPFVVMWARQRVLRRPNLELRLGDFKRQPLAEAGCVVCYLWPGAMTQLAERFRNELSVGAKIVTNTFALRGWVAERELQLRDLYRTRVYRYVR